MLTFIANGPLTEDKLDSLLDIVTAQIRFLQAEKGVGFVYGKFGNEDGSLFKEVQGHASSFSSDDIATLERVVQLSNAWSSQQCVNHHGSSQCHRGGYSGPCGHGFGVSGVTGVTAGVAMPCMLAIAVIHLSSHWITCHKLIQTWCWYPFRFSF